MRISDWSSDVCSSDLALRGGKLVQIGATKMNGALRDREPGWQVARHHAADPAFSLARFAHQAQHAAFGHIQIYTAQHGGDRKSVDSGKSVSVRVDLGGRRIIKKKKQSKKHKNK